MKILVYTSIYSTEYEKYYLSLFYIFNQNIKLLSVLTDREFKKLIEIYFMILDYLNTNWIFLLNKKNQYVSSDNDMKK